MFSTCARMSLIMYPKEIYLIRHGETDLNLNKILQGGRVNASINATGREQAVAFFRKYQDVPFKKIYTSCLQRSIESVKLFSEKGIPTVSLAELNEMDYGVYDGGIPSEEEQSPYLELVRQWEVGNTYLKPEGGESPVEVQVRMKKLIEILRSDPEETPVLVSMHGRALRILLATMLRYDLRYMCLFPHRNLCLYIITDTGNLFSIEKFNDTSHLQNFSDPQRIVTHNNIPPEAGFKD